MTCLLASRRAIHASAWRRALAVPPQQFGQVVATARVRMKERTRLLDEVRPPQLLACAHSSNC